ncbi:hypothetical protein GNF85_07800 [Clostridium perfringens]|uniref:hypothetical protein n=1 Tax=Clostridium perfringens TaxID=1502 RepID=UPI001094BC88|nr:hypothetical protein [Clostridium perfringens]TGY46753.1 hypothetical protein E5346_03685 [Clostridium perfringens]
MKYRVYSNMGMWGWSDFRREAGLKILDHNTTGNVVNYIDYEFVENLDKDILKKYEVKVEILDDNDKVTRIIDYRSEKDHQHEKKLYDLPKYDFKKISERQKELKRLKKEYSQQLYNELPKDCSSCEFNFGDVCASEYYGDKIEELEKKITNCNGWSVDLDTYCEIGNKIREKFKNFNIFE